MEDWYLKNYYTLWLFVLAAISTQARGEEPLQAQWIVVAAPAFRQAIKPLCQHRQAQNFHVVVVQTTDILNEREILAGEAARLRDHVRKLCREHKGTSFILLVGAVEPNHPKKPARYMVPPLRGTVSRMKGEPSDNGYGCQGDSLLPVSPVGRFPARTVAEAQSMVEKTLAYERNDQPGAWKRRLTVLAGIPEYNPIADKLVESLAIARLSKLHPSWTGKAIYHNPSSRFCVPDDRLQSQALKYVEEGQAVTLYLGHSGSQGFWAGKARYLDRADWGKLKIKQGPGIFVTFGCNGCQLRGLDGEGYGVTAIRNPGGPVAVIGSHGVCFAAMVHLAADGLVDSLFAADTPERIGEPWLRLKVGLAKGKIGSWSYALLDSVDGDPRIPQATQRREHLEMFVLLGDPALRLPRLPTTIKLTCTGTAAPGETISIKGWLPPGLERARVQLGLERPVASDALDLEPLPPPEKAEARAQVMLANHEKANRFAIMETELTAANGNFEHRLKLPDRLPWPHLNLRAYAATDRKDAVGTLVIPITKNDDKKPRTK